MQNFVDSLTIQLSICLDNNWVWENMAEVAFL